MYVIQERRFPIFLKEKLYVPFRQMGFPSRSADSQSLDDLDALASDGDVNETPFNVFIGHNPRASRVHDVRGRSGSSTRFRMSRMIVRRGRWRQRLLPRCQSCTESRQVHAAQEPPWANFGRSRCGERSRTSPRSRASLSVLDALGQPAVFLLAADRLQHSQHPLRRERGMAAFVGCDCRPNSARPRASRSFLAERHTLWVIDGQHRPCRERRW